MSGIIAHLLQLADEQPAQRLVVNHGEALYVVNAHVRNLLHHLPKRPKKAQKALVLFKIMGAVTTERVLHETTDRHLQVSVETYRSTWVSSTEALLFEREDRRQKLIKR